MFKWIIFWLVVGCVWLVVAPAIAAVVVIGSIILFMFRGPRRKPYPTTRVRITIRDHKKSPSQSEDQEGQGVGHFVG